MNEIRKNILIIGTGPTGSSCAYLINKMLTYFAPFSNLTVIEKGNKPGGRLSTTFDDKGNNLYDLGFRYIPYNRKNVPKKFKIFNYQDVTLYTNRYYCPIGFTNLFQKNLDKINVLYNTKVIEIDHIKNNDKLSWQITTETNEKLMYDFIISTIPIPQFLQLNGNFMENFDTSIINNMNKVQYSNVLSLGITYDKLISNQGWLDVKYDNDKILDWVCLESNRNKLLDKSRVIIQTKPQWSIENFNRNKYEIENILINSLKQKIPEFDDNIQNTKLMRWKYANVINNTQLNKIYFKSSLIYNNILPMVIAGDSVVGSDFNNCLDSATSAFLNCEQFVLDL